MRVVGWVAAAACVVGAVVVSRGLEPDDVGRVAGAATVTPRTEADLPVLADAPMPSVTGATGWLNTTPLTRAAVAGSVVLVDFWTFGCINCRHTQPYVQAWHRRYQDDGLVVLSVHTPEFAYEAEADNVRRYVAEQHIEYPVALDPDRTVWRAWDNHAWPAFYLYDRDGRLRRVHIGEGGYDDTEDAIRALLEVDPAAPRASPVLEP